MTAIKPATRWLFVGIVTMLLCIGCTSKPKHFTHEVLNRMTPVKDQGNSETCWIYAMLATIETEHLSWGDSVNLSPYYIEKMMEQEPDAPKSKRGELATLLRLMEKYGIVSYDAMRSIDTPAPKWVFMLGATYTPQEFAHSVCKPGEYIQLMSTPKKPYYEESELEVPDNWMHDRYLNIPKDSLLVKAERAVKAHHGVCWSDDNHGMAIVGIAHDDDGEKYFVMKNSWGDNRPYGGLVYISFKEFLSETVSVVMTKEAYERP
jgi:bleomycin hydrolase